MMHKEMSKDDNIGNFESPRSSDRPFGGKR